MTCSTCKWVKRFAKRDDEPSNMGCSKPGFEGYTSDTSPACDGAFYMPMGEAIHPTCREFAYGVGHDQAKTMGVPLTDEPFYAWLKRRDAALAADAEKWGKP